MNINVDVVGEWITKLGKLFQTATTRLEKNTSQHQCCNNFSTICRHDLYSYEDINNSVYTQRTNLFKRPGTDPGFTSGRCLLDGVKKYDQQRWEHH